MGTGLFVCAYLFESFIRLLWCSYHKGIGCWLDFFCSIQRFIWIAWFGFIFLITFRIAHVSINKQCHAIKLWTKKNYKNCIYWNAHAHSTTHTLTRSFGVPYNFCLLNSLRSYFFPMQFNIIFFLPEFVWNVRNIIWLHTHYIAQCT